MYVRDVNNTLAPVLQLPLSVIVLFQLRLEARKARRETTKTVIWEPSVRSSMELVYDIPCNSPSRRPFFVSRILL